jgi:hypothetical protein
MGAGGETGSGVCPAPIGASKRLCTRLETSDVTDGSFVTGSGCGAAGGTASRLGESAQACGIGSVRQTTGNNAIKMKNAAVRIISMVSATKTVRRNYEFTAEAKIAEAAGFDLFRYFRDGGRCRMPIWKS